MLGKLIEPEIKELVESRRFHELKEALREISDLDVAELIDDIEPEDKGVVFRLLLPDQAIDVFEYLSIESQESLIRSLANERLAHILEEMAPDDRTEMLEELPAKVTRNLLSLLSPDERRVATKLLGYPEDSAGRLMTPDLIWIRANRTAAQALEKIRRIGKEAETFNVCYVVDDEHRLKGVVTLAKLVLTDPDRLVEEIMYEPRATVSVTTDREEAASLCARYDILALPVLDQNEKLVGIVTVDDLVDVIEEEATEDIHFMAGVLPPERPYIELGATELWWRRIVWLIMLVMIELVAGFILSRNTDQLSSFVTLALFIPAMIATGGNCGTQSSTMVIRAMATSSLSLSNLGRILRRELLVGLMLGTAMGLVVYLLAFILNPILEHPNPVPAATATAVAATGIEAGPPPAAHTHSPIVRKLAVSLSVGVSLGLVLFISNLIGVMLPLIVGRLGMDPALMAGPFISTLNDVFGMLMFFGISHFILTVFLG